MESFQETTLAWLSSCSPNERKDFLLAAFGNLKKDELKLMKSGLVHATKRRLRDSLKCSGEFKSEIWNKKKRSSGTAPDPAKAATEPAPEPKEEALPGIVQEAWFDVWLTNRTKIVAIDCEMVQLFGKTAGFSALKAALVCTVNFFGKVIYQSLIYHAKDSFVVNYHTKKVNGFERGSLADGIELPLVSKRVAEILQDKLVITVNGEGDFRCLELDVGDFCMFDLHSHWHQWNGTYTKFGVKNYAPISLRRLNLYYFNEDIQAGAHCPEIDARATMRIFRDKYLDIKTSNLKSQIHDDFDEFNVIPKLNELLESNK